MFACSAAVNAGVSVKVGVDKPGMAAVIAALRASPVGSVAIPAGFARPVTVVPSDCRITPAMPTLSLDATVLLTMALFSVSTIEIPPPAQPATLLTIMLFVIDTRYQLATLLGLLSTS